MYGHACIKKHEDITREAHPVSSLFINGLKITIYWRFIISCIDIFEFSILAKLDDAQPKIRDTNFIGIDGELKPEMMSDVSLFKNNVFVKPVQILLRYNSR